MAKVTGVARIKRQALLPLVLVSCLIASIAPANACRVNPPRPTEAQLHAAPDDAEVAAKAIVKRVIFDGQSQEMSRPRFWLELEVVEVFKGEPGPLIKVGY